MNLTQKFEEATSNNTLRINALEVDKKYPILKTQHIDTKYGSTVLLSIKDKSNDTIKVFLLKRYISVFSEEDVTSINSKQV